MSKADNMLAILWLLKANKRMTAKQLADALEMHIRTVYRYIDALCASGVPIVADSGHNGGYSLLPQFKESPLFFDLEEQKALLQAAVFAQEAGYPYGDVLRQALTKLKRYTNEEQRTAIDRHLVGFDVISSGPDEGMAPLLRQLEAAVAGNGTMLIEHHKGVGLEPQGRRIDPYGLVHWKGKWYVVAHCHLREEIRSFRVDRIVSAEPTDATFERPADFSARGYLLQFLKPWISADGEKLIAVGVEGKPETLNALCETGPFGDSLVERAKDRAQFMFEENAMLTYVPYYLLGYGAKLTVLGPPELKARMASLALELHEHYNSAL
ncbi:YafY family transcriptional regulator [Paenibacillus sp. MWE-103]|uniref:YafY family transcriptional regulator n=1 Tax=Paenibacillus artemisiicola TaxID=1172618 RepID=A0ABS3WHH1_9BACL|nr:YafY family transcriptional regulator [Paenibacillus artemisiicola]